MRPNILILITRLFCVPVRHPGHGQATITRVGSIFTTHNILKDFVNYVTADADFPEGSCWNPGQISYREVAHHRIEFLLPVSLRDFHSDLMPYMDFTPVQTPSINPVRECDFDKLGRRRATFLASSSESMVHPRSVALRTSASEWIHDCGYDNLRDMFSQTKNETEEWLGLVHALNVTTNPVSPEEIRCLIEILGDGPWVKGILVLIDTSVWLK